MQKDKILNVLIQLGLLEKEAKVYLACFELGASPVSKLSKLAGINRITTYDVLDKLKKNGLVSYFLKNKIKYFEVVSPTVLFEMYEARLSDFKTALSDFDKIKAVGEFSEVSHFEGKAALFSMFYELLEKDTDEACLLVNNKLLKDIWPNIDAEFSSKLKEKGVFLKKLVVDDRKSEILLEEDSRFFRETRVISDSFLDFSVLIFIFSDLLYVASLGEDLYLTRYQGIDYVRSYKFLFQILWEKHYSAQTLKNKMLSSLSESELSDSISELSKPLTHDKKDLKDNNLSLF